VIDFFLSSPLLRPDWALLAISHCSTYASPHKLTLIPKLAKELQFAPHTTFFHQKSSKILDNVNFSF